MTWYADEIILRATPRALEVVVTSAQLAPFSYLVRSLAGHEWHTSEIQHTLPPEGLLFIRPVTGVSCHGFDWYETPILDWNTLAEEPNAGIWLDQQNTQQLSNYLDDDSMPPLSFRKAVASLASMIQQVVLYYSCGMWGGDIDYEYCLVYQPAESLFSTKPTLPPTRPGTEDALRAGLSQLGLTLPTGYFAPHVRSFAWETYKLR